MTPTDFWGVVLPAWLGAVGTIAASAVALVALLIGQRARGGVRNIAAGLNRNSEPSEVDPEVLAEALRETGIAAGSLIRVRQAANPWDFQHDGASVRFRNLSGELIHLTAVDTIGGLGLVLHDDFPLAVPDGASFEMLAHRTIGGGEVRGITLSLGDGERGATRAHVLPMSRIGLGEADGCFRLSGIRVHEMGSSNAA